MSKKLNTEEFIKRSIIIHGERYDYSKVKYIDSKVKICIICPIHGEFWQYPYSHLSGCGCKMCAIKSKKDKLLKTINEFIKDAIKVHGTKYDYSKVKYKGRDIPVLIICPTHGEFYQRPSVHLRKDGHGCPMCAIDSSSIVRSKTTEQFVREARGVHGDFYDYSNINYVNTLAHITIICPIHGAFTQTPSSHLSGRGCPKCANNKRSENNRGSKEDFIKKAVKTHGDKYDYSLVEYVNNHTPVKIYCKFHKEYFYQLPYHHIEGCGCPMCSSIGVSSAEKEIYCLLKTLYSGEILRNTKRILSNKIEIDLFVQELNLAFEFNGYYWHSTEFKAENQYKHINKTKLCEEKGIKLFHVWESDWLERREWVEEKIRRIFDTKNLKIPTEKIVEIDRSWPEFDMDEMEFCGYKLVEEQEPSSFTYKNKYTLFDCGKLIYEKVD